MDKEKAKQILRAWCKLNGISVMTFYYNFDGGYVQFEDANSRAEIDFKGSYDRERECDKYMTVDQAQDMLTYLNEK